MKKLFLVSVCFIAILGFSNFISFDTPFFGNELTGNGKLTAKLTKDSIKFSDSTNYKFYNEGGSLITKGRGKSFSIEKLPKGYYILCYGPGITAKVTIEHKKIPIMIKDTF